MVYTASALSLAMLEVMVGFDETEDMPADYTYAEIHLPEDLPVRTIAGSELPEGWDDPAGCASCEKLGSKWAEEAGEVALVVPSSIQGEEQNYLLNPRHPEYGQVTVARREPLEWDERIERMIRTARG